MRRCAKGDRNGRGNRGGSPRPDSARARCGRGAGSDGLGRRGLDGPIGTGSRRPAGRVFLVPETWEGSRGAPARRGPLAFPGATGPRGRSSRLAGEIPRRAGRGGTDRHPGPRPVRSGHPRVSEAGCGCRAACLRESLEIAYKRGDRYLAPYELVWLGRVALAQGSPARAATLFAAARTQFDTTGLAMDPDEGPEYEKGLTAIRAALDEKAFSAAWATGKKMSLDEAVALALRTG